MISADHPRGGAAGSEPVRLLFLIDQLCTLGGAERTLLSMIKALPKERFRCLLATFKMDPRLGLEIPCPLRVFSLRRTYDLNALRVALELRDFIRSEGVSIVHTFFQTSDLWGGVVAKLSGVRFLISSRRDMGMLSTKHRMAYRIVNSLFDLVLTVSEEVRASCISHGSLRPRNVVTLYNGFEIEKVSAANGGKRLRESLDLPSGSQLIISVAHIRKVKGLDILARAAAKVCREFPLAVFLVVGCVSEPVYFEELQELIRSLDLTEKIRFLGDRDDVLSLLKMSDVFGLPSRSEGFSNALLEAMACGLPCVATRVGGNGEAVEDQRSGYLVASEGPEETAEWILTLLRNPERAKEMGKAGREIVESRFSAQAMITQLVKLYDGLLASKHS